MKKGVSVLGILIFLAIAVLQASAQEGKLRYYSIPKTARASLVSNLTREGESWGAFDYQKALKGEYKPAQGILLADRILQIDAEAKAVRYWTFNGSFEDGSGLPVDLKIIEMGVKSPSLAERQPGSFYCYYSKTIEVALTNARDRKMVYVKVPVFIANANGAEIDWSK